MADVRAISVLSCKQGGIATFAGHVAARDSTSWPASFLSLNVLHSAPSPSNLAARTSPQPRQTVSPAAQSTTMSPEPHPEQCDTLVILVSAKALTFANDVPHRAPRSSTVQLLQNQSSSKSVPPYSVVCVMSEKDTPTRHCTSAHCGGVARTLRWGSGFAKMKSHRIIASGAKICF